MCFNQAKQGLKRLDNNKDIKQSHFRGCGCGSHAGFSTHAVVKQGNYFFNKRQGWKILNQVQDDLVLFTTTARGFTLIELLVVVLIIGILAAVALPQYQKAVEKAIMSEAITNVRTIANAHQLYHMATGEYLGDRDLDKLDIDIQGTSLISSGNMRGRYKSNRFVYAPNVSEAFYLAHARRYISDTGDSLYVISVWRDDPTRIHCHTLANVTAIQKKLCEEFDSTGSF